MHISNKLYEKTQSSSVLSHSPIVSSIFATKFDDDDGDDDLIHSQSFISIISSSSSNQSRRTFLPYPMKNLRFFVYAPIEHGRHLEEDIGERAANVELGNVVVLGKEILQGALVLFYCFCCC